MITIVDYGMGNLGSIISAFRRMDVSARCSSNKNDILNADKIILPGVGSFAQAMEHLEKLDLLPILNEAVLDKKIPILGICLGVQLFSRHSQEGNVEGLGWIDAETIRFAFDDTSQLKIPHMGWNSIEVQDDKSILSGIYKDDRLYFAHSYHLIHRDIRTVAGTTTYGYEFPSVIQKGNIIGIQCHPERSHKSGLKILHNFARI